MKYIFLVLFVFTSLLSFSQDRFKDGPFQKYYENGQLKIEGYYKNNKKVSIWKEYHDNGQLSNVYTYDANGKKTGYGESYYKNGNLNTKSAPLNDGVVVYKKYHEETKALVHEFYKGPREKKEQKMIFLGYYENGSLKTKAHIINGELQGLWTQYYVTSEKEWEVNYANGYKLGSYKLFYKNGNIKVEGEHWGGLKHGKEKRYNETGNLIWEGDYSNDLLNGTWINYKDEAEVAAYNFKEGKLKSRKNVSLNPTIVPHWAFEEAPVFPGCEKTLLYKGRRECMSKKITEFIRQNFNTSLAKGLGLEGKQRIFVMFKIDKKGDVTEVKARSSHEYLKEEAINVIKQLPKMKPGKQLGQAISVPYSLPIIFMISGESISINPHANPFSKSRRNF